MGLLENPSESAAVMDEPKPDDCVGLTACAAKVGVNKSTISRQLAKGLFKNWGTEREPLVSIAEVKKARSRDLDPALQRAPSTRRNDSGYAVSRAAREEINRQLADLDLKERLGLLLERRQVEDDLETFSRNLREKLRQRASTLVLELEQLPTNAARVAHMTEADDRLLTELSDELENLADGGGG